MMLPCHPDPAKREKDPAIDSTTGSFAVFATQDDSRESRAGRAQAARIGVVRRARAASHRVRELVVRVGESGAGGIGLGEVEEVRALAPLEGQSVDGGRPLRAF